LSLKRLGHAGALRIWALRSAEERLLFAVDSLHERGILKSDSSTKAPTSHRGWSKKRQC